MTKAAATVQSSGASLSAAAGAGGIASTPAARPQLSRAPSSCSNSSSNSSSASRMCTRTIVETAACPPEMKRGGSPWCFSELRVQKMLGESSMSSVVHCVCSRSGVHAAVKMYHRDRMNIMNIKQVSREIEIHALLLHPNIVRLYAAFEDADGIYLVQEYASRGDLYVELSRRGGYMPEAYVVKSVLIPFLSALTYMHSQGVLHRDIKPENIMVGGGGEVKVGDFGLAINTTREKPMSRVGTLDYMAPEIVRLPYGCASSSTASKAAAGGSEPGGAAYGLPVDAWCVGVLAHELLVGAPPFEAESKDATYTRILKLEPSLPSHLSEHARDFIRQALNKDPAKRPTVHQLLRHPWLRAYQRPRSMLIVDSPNREQLTGAGSSLSRNTSAVAAQLAAARLEMQLVQQAQQASSAAATAGATAGNSPTSAAAAVGMGPGGAAVPAAPAAPAVQGSGPSSQRPASIGKSLSFSSAMAGRFSSVKPSKPSPFSRLLRPQTSQTAAGTPASVESQGQAVPQAPASARQYSLGRLGSTATTAAAAAVAEYEAEQAAQAAAAAATATATAGTKAADGGATGAAVTKSSAGGAGKAGTAARLVIQVQAAAGGASLAGTPTAATARSLAPVSDGLLPAHDGLIRAALSDGTQLGAGSGGTAAASLAGQVGAGVPGKRGKHSSNSGSSGARGSFAAAIRRKLSGQGGFGLFGPTAPSAVAVAAAGKEGVPPAAAPIDSAAGGVMGAIGAVQAPSMAQLLAPSSGHSPAAPPAAASVAAAIGTSASIQSQSARHKRSSSGGSRLLSAIGKKFSLTRRSAAEATATAASVVAEEATMPAAAPV